MRATLRINACILLTSIALSFTRLAWGRDDPALEAAIHAALNDAATAALIDSGSRSERAALDALYASRQFAPLWIRDNKLTPQAVSVLQELRGADAYGLRSSDYASDVIPGLLGWNGESSEKISGPKIGGLSSIGGAIGTHLDPGRLAQSDVMLSAAAARFLTHLHFGRVDPQAVGFALGPAREDLDIAGAVTRLASEADPHRVIESVEPQFLHYRLLKEALPHYRQLAAKADVSDLPALPRGSIKPGETYAGVPALRNLLSLLGDLPPGGASQPANQEVGDPLVLDPTLVAALKRFQEQHGLAADGAIGRSTYLALTTPLSRRVRQIELTLERWRWLPTFDTPPIIVNIPEFRLFAFRSTQDRKVDILQMDVIVGRTFVKTRTPVFVADMRYLILRPYWDVPYSITTHEMLPVIRTNPGYLEAQHLEIVRGESDETEPLPASPENIEALASGKLRLRQRPGADNALGLIKFMLPNSYNVYLHSTPAHRLFSESRRTFSHGCIRVSDPVALADHVLKGAPGDWTPQSIEAAMNGSTTLRVNLAKPIRVMILYGTALATEDGSVLFFDDIYGHDRKLEALLRLGTAG